MFAALLLFLASLTLDDGIGIDPNGGRPAAVLDHRCTIDPNGAGCRDELTLDRGAGLDPDGVR